MTAALTTSAAGSMAISELIGASVTRVDPAASLVEVSAVLAAEDIGIVAVGSKSEVLGVVSERDVVRAVGEGKDPEAVTAGEVAHRDLVWCDATATVAEVGMEMMQRWVRHVLVERRGKLAGIVSARDLLGAYVAGDSDFD